VRRRYAIVLLAPLSLLALVECGRAGTPPGGNAGTSPSGSVSVVADANVAQSDTADTLDATLDVAKPKPKLAARAQMAWVLMEARPGAQKAGYLRAGAVVDRDEKPTNEAGCSKGWYGIEPRGYVCAGDNATTDLDDPIVKSVLALGKRPDLSAPLPYAYGVAKNALAPFYARVPTHAEAARLEIDLDDHLKRAPKEHERAIADAGPEYDAGVFVPGLPSFLENGGTVPNVSGLIKSSKALWAGRPRHKEGFAIVATFLAGPGGTAPTGGPEDRRFDLTTDYLLLPHDRLREVRPSAFKGIELDDKVTLPVVFTRPRHHIAKLKLEGGGPAEPAMAPRTPVPITGQTKRISGVDYYATTDGFYVKAEDVIRIDSPKSFPGMANKGEKWIDVSIAKQALVAYEGSKPVYATLVSTGRDGLGDPESTKATIRGLYRIHTKHVTITMDSNEVGEEFSLRDVPYVQYFETGYALHGAYWHDGFGEPRSHGCINLAEIDAAWLFKWTGPELPKEWHGVMARPMSTGTQIWIHP